MDVKDRRFILSCLGTLAFVALCIGAYFLAPYTRNPQLVRGAAGVALAAAFVIFHLAHYRRGR